MTEETLINQVAAEAQNNNDSARRISQLHAEINKRDMQINDLEEQLAIKDEIVRKQTIRIAELEHNQFGRR